MVFNEILIPQDSFTETNVTRKRSVVGDSHFIKKPKKYLCHTCMHLRQREFGL